jgi:PEP-CTERM motif
MTLLAATVESRADAINFTTNATSGFNDQAVWGGQCFTSTSSLTTTSANGIGVTATSASGGNISWNQQGVQFPPAPGDPGCYILDSDGNPVIDGSFYGNFKPGDGLVWSYDFDNGVATGAIELDFTKGVAGIGTQFQDIGYGSFTAELSIYNGDVLLGTYVLSDQVSDGAADGSAAFLGIFDSTGANITKAIAKIDSCSGIECDPDNFFINQILLAEPTTPVPTPEPASLLLSATGLIGFGLTRLKRRKTS